MRWFLISVLLSACAAGHELRWSSAPKLAGVKSVVVFPFQNLSSQPDAGEITGAALAKSLRDKGLRVIEPRTIDRYLKSKNTKLFPVSPSHAARMARTYKVDAAVFGTVHEFVYENTARTVKPAVGITIWVVSATADERPLFVAASTLSDSAAGGTTISALVDQCLQQALEKWH